MFADVEILCNFRHPTVGVRTGVVFNVPLREIDTARHRLVNAAQIQRQVVIHVHPHIIITGEFEDDVLAIILFIGRNDKVNAHAHAEVMIQFFILVNIQIIG